ncbi:MAG: glycosyltransferase family 4 protein, partial [Bacteroidota bacterium]|nr:glycosyltransferase family 4 protein [Bacteroidota bacterium]
QTKSHKGTRRLAITAYMLSMGGDSNFILELGKFLKSNGYDVSIICTDGKGDWYEKIGQEGFKGKFFNSAIYEWIPFGRIMLARRVGRYMRKGSFDYIINNHSFYIHAAAGYIFGSSRIMHVVHNQLEQMVELESDPLSDRIVGVSPRIEELAQKHLPSPMVTSILNGIKLPGKPLQQYEQCSDRPGDILYVGRIDNRQKAVFLIPDIMHYLLEREIRTTITLVGNGPDFEELKQMVQDQSLSEFIILTGKVEPEEVGSYYNSSKILLLPSNFEGHPLTLMEAMARGCVPVSSLLPQCTDTCIEEGKSGYLVDVGKVHDFGRRLEELLNDEEHLNQMSKNALLRAREHFSNTVSHQKYLDLLRSFEGKKMQRDKFSLINRKYLTWKEMVPFQLILFVKRKILKSL